MFKLDKNAVKWGEGLINKNGPMVIEFDLYYIFLIVGLGLKQSQPVQNGSVFTKNYPKAYEALRHKIAALLLYTDLKASGFEVNNKANVKSAISETLSSSSYNFISDDAIEKLNGYANGGYHAIKDVLHSAPPNASIFLNIINDEFLPELFNF